MAHPVRGPRRRRARLSTALTLLLALVATVPPVAAEEPVLAAIQSVQAERRAAIHALRDGDRDRARALLRRLETRWHIETSAIPMIRRTAEPGLGESIRRFDAGLTTAAALVELGAADEALELLEDLGDTFSPWRSARRIAVLSDCIDAFSRSWEKLELSAGTDAHGLAQVAGESRDILARCASLTGPSTVAEFRALRARLDGSLTRLEEALRRGDMGSARRLIGEQRPLERMLAYRFG